MVQVNSVVRELNSLRTQQVVCNITGDYKGYKNATKAYNSLAVKNYDAFKESLKNRPSVTAPLFSRVGLNMAKVWFLNLFRTKTSDEKLLRKMMLEERAVDFIKEERWG